MRVTNLLSGATGTGPGSNVAGKAGLAALFGNDATAKRSFQASGSTSSGAGTATIAIEVTNDENAGWLTLGTITLNLSTTVSCDGFVTNGPWAFVRANVTGLTGTGAAVSANMGV